MTRISAARAELPRDSIAVDEGAAVLEVLTALLARTLELKTLGVEALTDTVVLAENVVADVEGRGLVCGRPVE